MRRDGPRRLGWPSSHVAGCGLLGERGHGGSPPPPRDRSLRTLRARSTNSTSARGQRSRPLAARMGRWCGAPWCRAHDASRVAERAATGVRSLRKQEGVVPLTMDNLPPIWTLESGDPGGREVTPPLASCTCIGPTSCILAGTRTFAFTSFEIHPRTSLGLLYAKPALQSEAPLCTAVTMGPALYSRWTARVRLTV